MSIHRNQIRVDQTRQEFRRLQAEIESWLQRRRAADTLRQYHTQLTTLQTALFTALERLQQEVEAINVSQATGPLYVACRKMERLLLSVRRVWDYYRLKFDQRDDPTWQEVLAAADEIVWSCYSEPYQNAAVLAVVEVKQGPAPLPYIEPQFSPQAIPRAMVPPELKIGPDADFLAAFIHSLPIPLVSLPPNCVQAPWWLIYLGHETGHHLQFDLSDSLRQAFGTALKQAALDQNLGDRLAQSWWDWNLEIFADLFSLLMMGPWALWAITELQLADEMALLRMTHPRYPPPVVRLGLMAHILARLGLPDQPGLQALDPAQIIGDVAAEFPDERDPRHLAALHWAIVPHMAQVIAQYQVEDMGRLAELCGWSADNYRAGGPVEGWAEALVSEPEPLPQPALSAARLIISGAVAAWANIYSLPDRAEQQARQHNLAHRLLPLLKKSREEGTRSSPEPPAGQVGDPAHALVDSLLTLSPDRLEVR